MLNKSQALSGPRQRGDPSNESFVTRNCNSEAQLTANKFIIYFVNALPYLNTREQKLKSFKFKCSELCDKHTVCEVNRTQECGWRSKLSGVEKFISGCERCWALLGAAGRLRAAVPAEVASRPLVPPAHITHISERPNVAKQTLFIPVHLWHVLLLQHFLLLWFIFSSFWNSVSVIECLSYFRCQNIAKHFSHNTYDIT